MNVTNGFKPCTKFCYDICSSQPLELYSSLPFRQGNKGWSYVNQHMRLQFKSRYSDIHVQDYFTIPWYFGFIDFFFFLRHGLTMLSSLAWNSLSRGGWTQTPSVSAFLVLGSKACATVVFPKPIWMGEVNGENKEEWLDLVMHTFMSWTDVSFNPTLVKNS